MLAIPVLQVCDDITVTTSSDSFSFQSVYEVPYNTPQNAAQDTSSEKVHKTFRYNASIIDYWWLYFMVSVTFILLPKEVLIGISVSATLNKTFVFNFKLRF
jgi:hypothetical protein